MKTVDVVTTHSVVITTVSPVKHAVVWYPDNPDYVYFHWIKDDGTIRPDHYHVMRASIKNAADFVRQLSEA